MAARPSHGNNVFVGDTEELAEVRWVSASEADELMAGAIFEPVRRHLQETLQSGTVEADQATEDVRRDS